MSTRRPPSESQPAALAPSPAGPAGPAEARAPGRVLVLVAHPQMELSRVNRELMRAAGGVAGVEVRDLYALYPDYLIDVPAERRALQAARLVVWQHPIHWYGMPPLMKLWADDVLGFGWAYGPEGHELRGKDLWLVVTTGGPETSYQRAGYNRYPFDAFLPAYEQTAALCGMRFLTPMVVHGAHRLEAATVTATAQHYAGRLAAYPDWPDLGPASAGVPIDVPTDARPPIEADERPSAVAG
jgi:glutathione-regulated potassium-efflux system ancillary protein KefF